MASASQVRVALGSGCAITFMATQLLASPPKPKPCPSEKARKETFDQLAKKWDVLVRSDEFLAGIGKLRRRLIQKATGEVLEVAVGSGRNFSYYNGGKVTAITAVDFSRAMLEVADEKRKEIEPIPLRLKLASTHRLDFEDGSFDTVVDTFGICSFEQPVQALQEMRRVMKEDGQADPAKGWCCLPQSRQPSAPLPPDAPLQVIQETLFNQGTRAATFLCRDRLDVGCMSPDTSQFSILDTVPPDLKREVLQLASMEPNAVRAMGAMVGMAVADSVGAFLEFLPVGKKGSRFNPQTLKVEGSFNKFKLKPGQWTDDTSMALCLADSLLVCEGYDGADIRVRFWNWWHRGYNNAFRRDKGRHASVGLGGNVAQSLKDVQNNSPSPRFESTSQDAGNGSLMRLAPVPIFFSSTCEKAAALSEESSRTTHPGKVAAAACHFLGFFLSKAISRGADPSESAAQFLSKVVEDYLTWPWSSAINRKLARVLRSEPSTDGREQCWNWRDPKGPFLEETLDARGSSYNGYPVRAQGNNGK
ncbi:unnamed protein product [Cladocopium goreaui]|uniref:ADP-ribosylarginine hydrolase Tri1 (Immunit y protein Tri1) (Tri1-Sp) n=1 Tax=Cladocopium goreaui TaxID=2562237 RepID=A0A9P1DN95_9DINO|nr:unnamed protein product [Cladocopium goreaui]